MLLTKMLKELESKGRSKNTFIALNKTLVKAENCTGKPLEDLTLDEVLNYIETVKQTGKIKRNMKGKPLSNSTIRMLQVHFIQFFRWCFDETDDAKYLSIAKKLKKKSIERTNNHLNPQDLLSPVDVKKLINAATIERDRCLCAVLFESGMRIGELMNLTNDMIVMDEVKKEVVFHIPDIAGSKTGARIIPCIDIYGYVKDWMKCNTSGRFMPVSQPAVRVILTKLFNRAGIDKPSNPHIFRHSAITNSVNLGLQAQFISQRYWGISNSHMVAVYVHLSEQQQAKAYKKAKGKEVDEDAKTSLSNRCVKCGSMTSNESLCPQCQELQRLSDLNKTALFENAQLKNRLDSIEKLLSSIGTPRGLLTTDSITFEKGAVTMKGTVNKEMSESEIMQLKKELEGIVKKAEKQKA